MQPFFSGRGSGTDSDQRQRFRWGFGRAELGSQQGVTGGLRQGVGALAMSGLKPRIGAGGE